MCVVVGRCRVTFENAEVEGGGGIFEQAG